jgi:hypothetical protein
MDLAATALWPPAAAAAAGFVGIRWRKAAAVVPVASVVAARK